MSDSSQALKVEELVRSVRNIRDLAECAPHLKPGCVFRCALPHTISDEDVSLLRDQLRVSVLIDLRTAEEQLEDAEGAKLWQGARFVRHTRSMFGWSLKQQVLQPGAIPMTLHHISFLERLRFYQGLVFKIPFTAIGQAAVLRLTQQPAWRSVLVKEVNERGLPLLYEILLDGAQPEILTALNVVAAAVKGGRPVMFFCRAGKDRTGMLAMLLQSACGIGREEIIADYIRSDKHHMVALAGIEKRAELAELDRTKFQGAPAEAIQAALDHLDRNYGGPRAYLDYIGFSFEQQAELASLLQQAHRFATAASA